MHRFGTSDRLPAIPGERDDTDTVTYIGPRAFGIGFALLCSTLVLIAYGACRLSAVLEDPATSVSLVPAPVVRASMAPAIAASALPSAPLNATAVGAALPAVRPSPVMTRRERTPAPTPSPAATPTPPTTMAPRVLPRRVPAQRSTPIPAPILMKARPAAKVFAQAQRVAVRKAPTPLAPGAASPAPDALTARLLVPRALATLAPVGVLEPKGREASGLLVVPSPAASASSGSTAPR